MDALATDYRVIAMDTRGHGESDKPHDAGAYGAEMARDVVRLLDHLNLPKAHVVGYSMGARITGYMLVHHADRLLTATLGGSPPRPEWSDEQDARAVRFIANVEEQARNADPDDGQDYVALAVIPLGWREQSVSESELAATSVPTLAVVGTEDVRLPQVRGLKSVIPGLQLIEVEGGTHGATQRRPEFIHGVRAFLDSHRGR